MKKFLFVLLAVGVVGCSSEEATDSKENEGKPAQEETADMPEEGLGEEVEAKPVYTAEEGSRLLVEMAACESPYSCDAIDQLVEFGADAAPGLVEIAIDGAKPEQVRKNALYALEEIGGGHGARELYDAAMADLKGDLSDDMLELAAATTDEELARQLLDYSITAKADDLHHDTNLLIGFRDADHTMVMNWIKEHGTPKKDEEVALANYMKDHATADDLEYVNGLLGSYKDRMARHRLAVTLIGLGETEHFSVLMDGLKAKDKYDRGDAVHQFRDVADKCPEELKESAIALLEKVGKENATGYENRSAEKAIKAMQE